MTCINNIHCTNLFHVGEWGTPEIISNGTWFTWITTYNLLVQYQTELGKTPRSTSVLAEQSGLSQENFGPKNIIWDKCMTNHIKK